MAKWMTAEKARDGLRHAEISICPNVAGRTKEMIVQSKRAHAGSVVVVG